MPKIDPNIPSEEVDQKYTRVKSKRYGEHYRAKRGTHTPLVVTSTMRNAGEAMRLANVYGKVIFDAFKPFFSDIKDGTRWSRLVALFRSQLQDGDLDLSTLIHGYYFHRRQPLRSVLSPEVDVTQTGETEKSVVIKVNSKSANKSRYHIPDQYEQIVIAVFLDADFRATVHSDTKVFPISHNKRNEHIVTFPRPAGARFLVIAIKCNHLANGGKCRGIPSGMSVVSVEALKPADES